MHIYHYAYLKAHLNAAMIASRSDYVKSKLVVIWLRIGSNVVKEENNSPCLSFSCFLIGCEQKGVYHCL